MPHSILAGELTFVPEHERYREQPKLTPDFALDPGVQRFQTVDEHQCEQDDILRDLGHGEYCCHPFSEPCGRDRFGAQGRYLMKRTCILNLVESGSGLKPEEARYLDGMLVAPRSPILTWVTHLGSKFRQTPSAVVDGRWNL